MFVEILGVRSDIYDIELGTPQDSVLGPLLFILFMNDLPQYITSGRIFIYADDTAIIVDSDTLAGLWSAVDVVLNEFKGWCDRNRLLLNCTKTVYMEFFNKIRTPLGSNICFDGADISPSDQTTYLGIVFDRHLGWSGQVDLICKKLSSAFFALSVLKKSLDGNALFPFYYASVQSILSYGIALWGQSVGWERAFIHQKRIIRLMFDLPYRSSCRGYFVRRKILTLVSIYVLNILTYTHKNRSKYPSHSDVHLYNTRGAQKIYPSRHKHSFHRKAPLNAGCRLYNLLPATLTGLPTKSFEKQLRRILCDNAFYTMREFIDFLSDSPQLPSSV